MSRSLLWVLPSSVCSAGNRCIKTVQSHCSPVTSQLTNRSPPAERLRRLRRWRARPALSNSAGGACAPEKSCFRQVLAILSGSGPCVNQKAERVPKCRSFGSASRTRNYSPLVNNPRIRLNPKNALLKNQTSPTGRSAPQQPLAHRGASFGAQRSAGIRIAISLPLGGVSSGFRYCPVLGRNLVPKPSGCGASSTGSFSCNAFNIDLLPNVRRVSAR
jgi:hypothetical protein